MAMYDEVELKARYAIPTIEAFKDQHTGDSDDVSSYVIEHKEAMDA